MCGIFGFINVKEEYKQKLLALANLPRGKDSTGFVFHNGKGLEMWKDAFPIDEILKDDSLLPETLWGSKILLGHLRASSPAGLIAGSGATKANAHPFNIGKITGAHNGIIRNHKDVVKKYNIPLEYTAVDSMVAIWMLDNHGIKGLKELSGLIALWWVDSSQKDKLFLWTWNKQLAVAEKENQLIFSSDIEHLNMVTDDTWGITDLKENGQLLQYDLLTAKYEALTVVKGKATPAKKPNTTHYNNTLNFAMVEPEVWRDRTDTVELLATKYSVYRCDECKQFMTGLMITRTDFFSDEGTKCDLCGKRAVVEMEKEEREIEIAFLLEQNEHHMKFMYKELENVHLCISLDNVKNILGQLGAECDISNKEIGTEDRETTSRRSRDYLSDDWWNHEYYGKGDGMGMLSEGDLELINEQV